MILIPSTPIDKLFTIHYFMDGCQTNSAGNGMGLIPESLLELKDFILHHSVVTIGLLLLSGYLLGKLFERLTLPVITGYILAGLLMGGSLIGVVTQDMSENLHTLTDIALGVIALTIGGEFSFEKLKRTGIKVVTITLFEALFAFFSVTTLLTLLRFGFHYSLLMGAISSATAPAATLIIIREMRVRGEFVDHLYGVVALDDAVCIILFSIVFAIITPMIMATTTTGGVFAGFLNALLEITLSALAGFIGGFSLSLLSRNMYKVNEILIVSLSILFLLIAVSIALNLSLLIANIVMGATLVNLSARNRRVFSYLEPLTPPLFALFFIIAGTELNLSSFREGIIVAYGIFYILSRFLGKYLGVYLSSFITKASKKIRNFLGFCLFPQAGVAIGLALFLETSPVVQTAPPEVKNMINMIVNIVLFSVFINELVGPIISRFGILRGVDIERR